VSSCRLRFSPRVDASLFFFQAEDGIRDPLVTGVQTCALPISTATSDDTTISVVSTPAPAVAVSVGTAKLGARNRSKRPPRPAYQIGRASCRERVEISGGAGTLKEN